MHGCLNCKLEIDAKISMRPKEMTCFCNSAPLGLPTVGGGKITIAGSDFTSGTAVDIADESAETPIGAIRMADGTTVFCDNIESFQPNQIVCEMPPGFGSFEVQVTVGSQSSSWFSSNVNYKTPNVEAVIPNPANTQFASIGREKITITGAKDYVSYFCHDWMLAKLLTLAVLDTHVVTKRHRPRY